MGNVLNKHVAASGARKGQWVNCNAKTKCTLQNTTHITEQQLFATSAWLRSTGNKKTMKTITEADVSSYFKLDDANSREWNEKARKLALKVKGIPDPHGKINPFDTDMKMPEVVREAYIDRVYRESDERLKRAQQAQREAQPTPSRPQPRTFARQNPAGDSQVRVFRGETIVPLTELKAMEMQALKTGGTLSYDSATISSYDNGTPARVSINNLRFSGTTKFTDYINVVKDDADQTKRNSRAITVRMSEKDYNNFIEDAKKLSGVNLYVHKKEVTKGFFRSTVTATVDVRSKSPEAANRIYDYVKTNNAFKELTGLEENFTKPSGTEDYKGVTIDPDTKDIVRRVYQKIGSVESTYDGGRPLSMSDAHYLDSAQNKYLPEAIEIYAKFSAIKDPEVRQQGRELFAKQLTIIYNKIDKIGKQREKAALDEMRGHAAFLEDRSDALTGQGF